MAKKNKSKKSQQQQKRRPRVVRVGGDVRSYALDGPAAAHARLLMDPCSQELTHPIYLGADGGMLMRCEQSITVASGPTETGGIVAFMPGGSFGASDSTVYVNNTAITSDTTTTLLTPSPSSAPGSTFLINNSRAYRPVAACLQVMWPGSELNRQGFVSLGRISGAELDDARTGGTGTATNVAALRQLAVATTRTPEDHLEILWKPGAGDMVFADPNNAPLGSMLTQKQALFCAFAGIPVSTGLRMRFVVVYEYTPKSGLGLSSAQESRARSRNTIDDVLNVVDRLGINAVKAGRAAYNFVNNVGVGAMGAYRAVQGTKALAGAARLAIMAA